MISRCNKLPHSLHVLNDRRLGFTPVLALGKIETVETFVQMVRMCALNRNVNT